MRKFDFLEKLLDGVAVEWLSLGDVTQYEQPTKYLVAAKNYNDKFDIPVLTAGKTFILGYTDEVNGIYKASKTPVIIFDDFTTANKWVEFDFKVKSSAMKMITSIDEGKVFLKYIYYWLNTLPSELVDGDHKRQWIGTFTIKKIPIPCPENPKKSLAIQAEIVRILDNFAELTAELTARKKQYNYYRDQLLSFEDGDVEWKALGDVGELVRGNGLPKTDFTESGIPAIHYGQIYTYYGLSTTSTKSFVSPETAEKLKKVNKGDVVITNTSENLEDVGKAVVYLGERQAVTGGHATIFKPSEIILGKYFAYFTQTDIFSDEKRKYSKGTKVIDVSASDMAKISIPIPCPENPKKSLAIQAEIVRILDNFAELTAELTARKKQYNYYRDQLLSFEDGDVEWKTLGGLATYSKTRISSGEIDSTNYVGVDNLLQNCAGKTASNFVPTEGNLTEYRDGDVLVGNIRPYLKKIWHADRIGGTNGDVLVIHPTDEKVLPRYLYQVLADEQFFEYNMQHCKGAKMPRGDKEKIMEYLIPIPYPVDPDKSLAEQTRIVAILDKFDALTNSLTEGLPREIALRQKQYEYYRNLLLSFPKMEEVEG